jgi:hypothetical protein
MLLLLLLLLLLLVHVQHMQPVGHMHMWEAHCSQLDRLL